MSTDRELRNRIEALEANVQQLTADAESARELLTAQVGPVFAEARHEGLAFRRLLAPCTGSAVKRMPATSGSIMRCTTTAISRSASDPICAR